MKKKININKIIKEINNNLEDIAKTVIAKRIEKEKNPLFKLLQKQFFMELDSPLQHQPIWHQWGIITHTRQFMKFYDTQIQKDLRKWNILDEVKEHLSIEIDGISKSKLIYIGILLHDIGKFKKNYTKKFNHQIHFGFKNHEEYSYEIIKGELFPLLHQHYGLTPHQIEYIAMCARYHFELGTVRDIAKKSEKGYTIEFPHSNDFRDIVLKFIDKFEKYRIEIGLLFLADSYAKTDIAYANRTDEDIIEELKRKEINPKLINSIKQIPINVEVAKEYFYILNSS